jgi:BlaI family penicillinase repressor
MNPKSKDRSSEPPMPTAAEVDILAVLWQLGPATVREVHEELGKDSEYNTTLTQMRLMTDKGLLKRSERFRNHVYEPAMPREQMQQRIAGDLMQRVFGGSAKGLILGALGAKKVSGDELGEIRRMIDDLGKKKRGKR